MAKVTFSLDEQTVRTLRALAERTKRPQSLVVREAVAHYAAREERMTDEERDEWLRSFDALIEQLPARPPVDVDHELREVRAARHAGWTRGEP